MLSYPPPPPPAATSKALDCEQEVPEQIADIPPPPPPLPPPKPAYAPPPPTTTTNDSPDDIGIIPVTFAPDPPLPKDEAAPPPAPSSVTFAFVQPAGGVTTCTDPVYEYVDVDGVQVGLAADAAPAAAGDALLGSILIKSTIDGKTFE